MNQMKIRLDLKNEAKQRMKKLKFGDPVTNVCAGPNNPQKHSYFVEFKTKVLKINKFCNNHKDYFAKCTDRKGKFWDTEMGVIYPGHLSGDECKEIYAPIHAAHL